MITKLGHTSIFLHPSWIHLSQTTALKQLVMSPLCQIEVPLRSRGSPVSPFSKFSKSVASMLWKNFKTRIKKKHRLRTLMYSGSAVTICETSVFAGPPSLLTHSIRKHKSEIKNISMFLKPIIHFIALKVSENVNNVDCNKIAHQGTWYSVVSSPL